MMTPSRPGLKLSVVIAAWNGRQALERCLESLRDECPAPDIEIIAATNFDSGTAELLAKRFPFVIHLAMPSGTTVPILRTAGIVRAAGEIIALAEDHCTFGNGWCAEIKKAHLLPYSAIGGPVENAAVDRAVDWAVYFYDYGKYMLPIKQGAAKALSGNNASYKREILAAVEPSFCEGFFEPFTHGEIEKQGQGLFLIPSAIVYNQKNHKLSDAFAQCFHLARGYAAKRVKEASTIQRGILLSGSVILPALLTWRIVKQTVDRGRHISDLARALPALVLLLSSWSGGEFCGYLAGEGASAGKWK
ncbi:MAG TPA: glycosyltransferase [Bryobacteraceae bacterium]|jgi:glycosyltransferase involved in cell wall biosynthesis